MNGNDGNSYTAATTTAVEVRYAVLGKENDNPLFISVRSQIKNILFIIRSHNTVFVLFSIYLA
jgi:hypothetical protein